MGDFRLFDFASQKRFESVAGKFHESGADTISTRPLSIWHLPLKETLTLAVVIDFKRIGVVLPFGQVIEKRFCPLRPVQAIFRFIKARIID